MRCAARSDYARRGRGGGPLPCRQEGPKGRIARKSSFALTVVENEARRRKTRQLETRRLDARRRERRKATQRNVMQGQGNTRKGKARRHKARQDDARRGDATAGRRTKGPVTTTPSAMSENRRWTAKQSKENMPTRYNEYALDDRINLTLLCMLHVLLGGGMGLKEKE